MCNYLEEVQEFRQAKASDDYNSATGHDYCEQLKVLPSPRKCKYVSVFSRQLKIHK